MSKYGPKIQTLSFLAKDPEVRYKPDGTKIINLLVNDTPIRPGTRIEDKNHYIGEQIWLVAEAWAEKAEQIEALNLKKGDYVSITGRLYITRSEYRDKDGLKRVRFEKRIRFIEVELKDPENPPNKES